MGIKPSVLFQEIRSLLIRVEMIISVRPNSKNNPKVLLGARISKVKCPWGYENKCKSFIINPEKEI